MKKKSSLYRPIQILPFCLESGQLVAKRWWNRRLLKSVYKKIEISYHICIKTCPFHFTWILKPSLHYICNLSF